MLQVLGVLVCLRPWQLQAPEPNRSSPVAPMRLLVHGELRRWHVAALEDMSLMSHSQVHSAVDEADWHVYVFGSCPDSIVVPRGQKGHRTLPFLRTFRGLRRVKARWLKTIAGCPWAWVHREHGRR